MLVSVRHYLCVCSGSRQAELHQHFASEVAVDVGSPIKQGCTLVLLTNASLAPDVYSCGLHRASSTCSRLIDTGRCSQSFFFVLSSTKSSDCHAASDLETATRQLCLGCSRG